MDCERCLQFVVCGACGKSSLQLLKCSSPPRILEHDKHISEAVAAALPVDCLIFESEVTLPVALPIAWMGERWFVWTWSCKNQDPVALKAIEIHLLQKPLLTVEWALLLCLACLCQSRALLDCVRCLQFVVCCACGKSSLQLLKCSSPPRILEHDKHISEAVAAALPVDCLIFESEVTLPVACRKVTSAYLRFGSPHGMLLPQLEISIYFQSSLATPSHLKKHMCKNR